MDLGIHGKKALITGADSGTGCHTAKQLLAEGVTGAQDFFHEFDDDGWTSSNYRVDDGSVATI